jgi:23S rRNA (pseudouridine1915-N3)-methyltransferase
MEIQLVTIGRRAGARKHAAAEELLSLYAQRIPHFCPFELVNYATEQKFLSAHNLLSTGERRSNSPSRGNLRRPGSSELIFMDSRGRGFSTEQFADWLQEKRERGLGRLIFAVGPPGGWPEEIRRRAEMLITLGPMTLPHELAAVVLAEQIYRAFTIFEGHPYHLGHV